MDNKIILIISRIIFPFIILLSFYIQINGSDAPGGGFQAGVVMASALFLYAIIFGQKKALELLPFKLLKIIAMIGVLLYLGTGIACVVKGGEFLNYSILLGDQVLGQKLGITIVEWGVGLTVFASFSLIYFAFATRGKHDID